MTANELYKELYNLYGPVTRAWDCFLYTKKGVRLTDLFLENGRAILGWDGKSSFTMLKNTLNRGQTGGFICEENERLEKAVSELLTSKRKIFFFSNKMDALKAGLAISPESTSFWKPWNSNDAKNCACDATCDVGCDITCDVSSVVITPPLPWTDSIYILAVKTEEIAAKNAEPVSKLYLPFAVKVALTRSIYNLIAELKIREEKDWFIYDTVLTKYWKRLGPYLYPKIPKENYEAFVMHCLKNGILINPDYNAPSIVPYKADKGIFSKLKKSPFMAEGGANES